MKTIKLKNGIEMPVLGFGVCQVAYFIATRAETEPERPNVLSIVYGEVRLVWKIPAGKGGSLSPDYGEREKWTVCLI